MDTHNFKILKYSLDQDEVDGLCNFDYEENCPSCCDIYKSYLELYKQMISNKVSTFKKKRSKKNLINILN